MNSKWEEFAKEDPMYYIDTSAGAHPAADKENQFFRSGKTFADQTVERVLGLLPDHERALEIGCGMGRLTLPHAGYFDEVMAVDISATMLKELNNKSEEAGLANIRSFLSNEGWDDKPIGYAYSYLVFQHITDLNEIKNYIERIAGCLKEDGIAQLQFDTRTPDMVYRLRNSIPDAVLPRNQKKGIRRVRRDAAVLRSIFRKNKMKVVQEIGVETALNYFILRKLS